MENKLEYYAMMVDFNSDELIRINIFNNTKFSDGVDKLLKKFVSYENFKEELIKLLRYCFWSRAEYEIIVKDIFEKQKGTKIDIYYQVEKNIDILANYIINEHNKNINKK